VSWSKFLTNQNVGGSLASLATLSFWWCARAPCNLSKIHSALEQHRSQLQKQAAALRECFIDYEFRVLQVCVWNVVHLSLSDRNNRGMKFNQPSNSATHNCKNSFRKCFFEYKSSQVHTLAHTFGLEST